MKMQYKTSYLCATQSNHGKEIPFKGIICVGNYNIFKCKTLPALKKSLSSQIPPKREKARTFMFKVMYSPNFIFKR